MKKAVVIIPTYNERENIQRTIQVLLSVFKKITTWEMRILVVDDTSPDKTYAVVEQLSNKDKRVHLLLNKKKSGLGGAYLKGMQHAFYKMKADVVFEFDADLSHDPTKIPQFLIEIENGADLVLGSRYIPGGSIPADWGWHRKVLSRVGNLVIRVILTNFSIRDWTSGYRAIKKEVYEAVAPHLQGERFSGYSFQIGFLHTALKLGFKVRESVPYVFVDRTMGESKLGPEYIKNNLIFLFKVRLLDIYRMKFFRFAMVGGVGALVQLTSFELYRRSLPVFELGILSTYTTAVFLSIETAIVSNFIFNNIWTFKEQKLESGSVPGKFLAFNAASGGSILIQMTIATLGKLLIGFHDLFTIPLIGIVVDTGMLYVIIGILAGMFWNFFAYTTFIWNKKVLPKAAV